MYIIEIEEYFERENPEYYKVIGYFTSFEKAENYLIKEGYRKETYPTYDFENEIDYDEFYYTDKNEDKLWYNIADIIKLEEIE